MPMSRINEGFLQQFQSRMGHLLLCADVKGELQTPIGREIDNSTKLVMHDRAEMLEELEREES